MIILISFFGFCFENIWMLFRHSLVDNRNMFLPFLLGYGLFVVAIYHVIGVPDKILNKYKINSPIKYAIYMAIIFVLVSVGEIALGFFVQWVCGFYYWDYTSIPLHFTRYTSLPTSIGFALAISLFMGFAFIPLQKKIRKKSKKVPIFILIIVLAILVLDMNLSFKKMKVNKGHNTIWAFAVKK
ncbi:MAG: putative ABC transporter permease [Bacilli bacterium]|nr:putative ABC transporter permease [Bacilli bacterium]